MVRKFVAVVVVDEGHERFYKTRSRKEELFERVQCSVKMVQLSFSQRRRWDDQRPLVQSARSCSTTCAEDWRYDRKVGNSR